MTTETERRVPEHPGWRPHWLRYAEFAGGRVVLSDRTIPAAHVRWPTRYLVAGVMPDQPKPPACACGYPHWWPIASTDSLTEAEAAFELACERLREGG